MNPGRINSRTGLIQTLLPLVPSRACVKAIAEGDIRVLGGFKKIPPFGLPGWICCVRSKHGRTWLLGLMVDEIRHCFECHRIEEIPWWAWTGRANGDGWESHSGDEPHVSACNHGLFSSPDGGREG